ncbi:MAG: hypothetical protein RLZZ621_1817, partial [Gemmatimonadota bacterium]
AIVILETQHHVATARPGETPYVDRVDEVAKMQPPGWRRGKACTPTLPIWS